MPRVALFGGQKVPFMPPGALGFDMSCRGTIPPDSRRPFFAIHSGAAADEGGGWTNPGVWGRGRDYVVVKNVCPSGPFIIT